jgi:uncharacterized protein with HEPN domain
MNERDEVRLRDMLDEARRARRFVHGKTRADLDVGDQILGFAVVRALEIIGEAANKCHRKRATRYPRFGGATLSDCEIEWSTTTRTLTTISCGMW